MNTDTGSFVFILNAAFIVILSDAQQHPVEAWGVCEYMPLLLG